LAKKYTYKKADWGLADPSGKPDEALITVIKEIERKVLDLIEEVKEWENN
jgi:protein tyrosine phosphatase